MGNLLYKDPCRDYGYTQTVFMYDSFHKMHYQVNHPIRTQYQILKWKY